MKGLLIKEDMEKIIESMDSSEIAEMVNNMMFECFNATYGEYENLRAMVNSAAVSKEMKLHEGARTAFGENIDSEKLNEMYHKRKWFAMAKIGNHMKSYCEKELTEDVKLERMLAAAIKEATKTGYDKIGKNKVFYSNFESTGKDFDALKADIEMKKKEGVIYYFYKRQGKEVAIMPQKFGTNWLNKATPDDFHRTSIK